MALFYIIQRVDDTECPRIHALFGMI